MYIRNLRGGKEQNNGPSHTPLASSLDMERLQTSDRRLLWSRHDFSLVLIDMAVYRICRSNNRGLDLTVYIICGSNDGLETRLSTTCGSNGGLETRLMSTTKSIAQ
jgi:hypothetical protein